MARCEEKVKAYEDYSIHTEQTNFDLPSMSLRVRLERLLFAEDDKTKMYIYIASTLWNNLKDCTTTVSDFNSFKKLVKEQLKTLTFLPNCGKNDDFIYF